MKDRNDLSGAMERQRELQQELGAMLDSFRIIGLTAAEILDVLNSEIEIWEHRRLREVKPFDPHQRPHPLLKFDKPVIGPPGV